MKILDHIKFLKIEFIKKKINFLGEKKLFVLSMWKVPVFLFIIF